MGSPNALPLADADQVVDGWVGGKGPGQLQHQVGIGIQQLACNRDKGRSWRRDQDWARGAGQRAGAGSSRCSRPATHSTAQHSTAPHSSAPHHTMCSAAQCTAQHSTRLRLTVGDPAVERCSRLLRHCRRQKLRCPALACREDRGWACCPNWVWHSHLAWRQ